MSARACGGHGRAMARYLFHHRHQPHECSIVFASFKGGQARCATTPRSPPAPPADTRTGGRSTPNAKRTRSGCCPSTSHSAQPWHRSARSRSH